MKPLTPSLKKAARAILRQVALAGIANEPKIHYAQTRPFHYVSDLGNGFHTLDCSGFVGNAFWVVLHRLQHFIADPLNERYTGFGNTTTLEAFLREFGKRVTTQGYLIGDIARIGQGEHAHTIYCYKAGTAKTALWVSHGFEGGPLSVNLNYRPGELVGVWRHPALV